MKETPIIIETDKEQELIKRHFADNTELLKSIRALFYGIDITDAEKSEIKNLFSNPEMLQIFTNRLTPSIKRSLPIGQVQDVWMGVEQMVFGQSEITIIQAIRYKEIAIEMTKKALALLTNPDGEKVDISYKPNSDTMYGINLLARNQYLRHIEAQLYGISIIAGTKPETEKEVKERKEKNSLK